MRVDIDAALDLEVPVTRFGPRPVRILAENREPLILEAVVADHDPAGASLELPSDGLPPNRYILAVKTDEKTHFPLRRYVLLVH